MLDAVHGFFAVGQFAVKKMVVSVRLGSVGFFFIFSAKVRLVRLG